MQHTIGFFKNYYLLFEISNFLAEYCVSFWYTNFLDTVCWAYKFGLTWIMDTVEMNENPFYCYKVFTFLGSCNLDKWLFQSSKSVGDGFCFETDF